MKHKHADLMREWALDTSRVVQSRSHNKEEWRNCASQPTWTEGAQYRFKPEPGPDYYAFATILNSSLQVSYGGLPNIRFTFDGETNQLKAAEVLK